MYMHLFICETGYTHTQKGKLETKETGANLGRLGLGERLEEMGAPWLCVNLTMQI